MLTLYMAVLLKIPLLNILKVLKKVRDLLKSMKLPLSTNLTNIDLLLSSAASISTNTYAILNFFNSFI